jgi:hypothetical protein
MHAPIDVAFVPGTELPIANVTNTGDVTLTLHTLEDSHLGTLLLDFPYALTPGSSAFITQSAVITASVINTATWTAFNPGPGDVVSATDSASVYAWEASCPAGYEQILISYTDFEDFPPYGWTITKYHKLHGFLNGPIPIQALAQHSPRQRVVRHCRQRCLRFWQLDEYDHDQCTIRFQRSDPAHDHVFHGLQRYQLY